MAGPAYIKKRLWNAEVIIDPNNVLPNGGRLKVNGAYPMIYTIDWTGAAQAASEELGTAATSVKDGTTTPFQVTVVSTDVGDKRTTAAGFVHSVALIGLSVASIADYVNGIEDPKTTVEVVAMNGTTDVLSTRYYTWVDHAYACEWGTGASHDAEGNITIESPANTTLITITATYNESNGGVWHFPEGSFYYTEYVKIGPTATLAAGDGAVLTGTFTGHDQALNDASNNDVEYYGYIHYGGGMEWSNPHKIPPRYGSKAAKVLWAADDTANTPTLQISIVMHCSRYSS
jgi:hypothetical protein